MFFLFAYEFVYQFVFRKHMEIRTYPILYYEKTYIYILCKQYNCGSNYLINMVIAVHIPSNKNNQRNQLDWVISMYLYS